MGVKCNKGLASDVVLDYIKRHPKLPRQTLAKLVMKEQPGLYANLTACRSAVQYYTGAQGEKSRIHPVKHGVIRPKGIAGADAWEEMMPESWSEPVVPFQLPSSIRSLLVLSDIHVPFHEPQALRMAMEWGIAHKPDAVLLNGDTLDFYAISDHEKDPRKVRWHEELEAGRTLLRMVRKAFPNVPVYFKEGNHEYRMERHLMKHAPVLIGMSEFELPTLMRMGEVGVEYIRNKRLIYAGELTIGHGDEWRGSGGVNPGRWAGLKAKESILIGHFHRTSEHIDRTIRGSVRGYWSMGCLCELQPAYLPYNDWSHGFALVHLSPDGSFEVDNKKIIKGKVR
jgi:hypothetical protein